MPSNLLSRAGNEQPANTRTLRGLAEQRSIPIQATNFRSCATPSPCFVVSSPHPFPNHQISLSSPITHSPKSSPNILPDPTQHLKHLRRQLIPNETGKNQQIPCRNYQLRLP